MKAMYLILATVAMLTLASCSANENDLVVENSSTNTLVNTYGAINVSEIKSQPGNLELDLLPAMNVTDVCNILGDIRSHESSVKDTRTLEEQKSNKDLLKIEMSETMSDKYTFLLQLHMTKYADGSLFYSGYESECKSTSFKWYIKGFSFSCDNSQAGHYKFETQSFLYFKVNDNGTLQYMKIPFTITGTYNTTTQSTNFTYSL